MIQKLARARGVPVSFDKDGIGVTFKVDLKMLTN